MIFELNKRYGFTKFVIVGPSVAIKEGVYKSLQMTDDHFRALYSGTPFEYFLYDSVKLGQVRNFAACPQVQIMVVTVGAIIKKDVNNLSKDSKMTGGEKPIDLIRATRPIVIVDEPQSVDGGLAGRGKEVLSAMNPLCTQRHSATHVDQHHMVYRLDGVDAYERKLVKQIDVASATVEDAYNRPYVRLISTSNRRGVISAKVELDAEVVGQVRRRERTVQDGYDHEQETGRVVYRDCRIGEIRVGKERASVELRVSAVSVLSAKARLGETSMPPKFNARLSGEPFASISTRRNGCAQRGSRCSACQEIYNLAEDRGQIPEMSNPCRLVAKNRECKRKRFLTE